MSPSGAPVREVLGIEVTHEQLLRWRAWTMPVDQPFVVPAASRTTSACATSPSG